MIDLTGSRFGQLKVLHRHGTARNGAGTEPTWMVLCRCGVTKEMRGSNLRQGRSQSCGCTLMVHGMYGTPEYKAWASMIARCTNPRTRSFRNYGGRGIGVAPEWTGSSGFGNFLADVGMRPSRKHSLDRKNNNGNYVPGNVRWATVKQQARNKRTSRVLTAMGESLTLAEWTQRLGCGYHTIRERLRRGWSPALAVTMPVKSKRR